MADETPFHLQGNFAPIDQELTETSLEVEGAIPPELQGLYVRNGANPPNADSAHWFMGQGMVHGVRLEGGKAVWYRNRYVRTPMMNDPKPQRVSDQGVIDHTASVANTHVVGHAGQILALEEGSFPYLLDRELETVGCTDFDGRLEHAFTAHPHTCPVTGEMIAFGYGQLPPYLMYYRVSPDGKLAQVEEIQVPGPTMMHDFMITETKTLFMDLPVVFDLEAALAGTMPFKWSDSYGARIGIMPRQGTNADVRWFEVEPCFIFHNVNAWDDGDTVVLDACHNTEIWREAGQMAGDGKLSLRRFHFDLATGNVREETIDERPMEFPRVADARVGLKNRYSWTLAFGDPTDPNPDLAGTYKIDNRAGTVERREMGAGLHPGEPVFVPAAGSDLDSDAGYLMTFVYDDGSNRSELVILDATDFQAPPVARVKLPQRVPFGFHGSWIADA